ncbi:MAG TPA: phosphate ABC transporter substrate-binding protein PstS [Myxococcales bacterium]|jgi:phosphate transport system substrate-binding protein|nr:phosphate ABC transporter substrate-binding protein PstS [Myxococcales bacterium]
MSKSRKALASVAVLLGSAAIATAAVAAEITGAGASFPNPIYSKWADAYQKATGNRMNYQSIGSSGGIRQVRAKTVDFGASDAPLTKAELEKDGMIQFPTVFGGVVPVVNLPGVGPGQLKLTGPVLADIYSGKITKWNDKAIADLNPGVTLPGTDIGVVRRADGSGTTAIFTNYLAKVSTEWKDKIGEGTTVQWPVGLGGKGNEGVSAFVQRLPGSIGYVESAYAKQNKLAHVQMQNAAGKFVEPTEKTVSAAAAGWGADGNYVHPTQGTGADAWPIAGATYILMYRMPEKPQQAAEVLKFFDWAYKNGDKMALELDYVPMPDNMVKQIEAQWASSVKDASGKSLWPAQ